MKLRVSQELAGLLGRMIVRACWPCYFHLSGLV